jgi:exonuclease III
MQDLRGTVRSLPNSVSSSRQSNVISINEFYLRRLLAHLHVGNSDGLSKQKTKTRKNKEEGIQQESRKKWMYIALWHFDKGVLHHYGKGRTHVPKTMSKDTAVTKEFLGADGKYSKANVHVESNSISLVSVFYSVSEAFNNVSNAKTLLQKMQYVQNVQKIVETRKSSRSTIVMSSLSQLSSSSSSSESGSASKKRRVVYYKCNSSHHVCYCGGILRTPEGHEQHQSIPQTGLSHNTTTNRRIFGNGRN